MERDLWDYAVEKYLLDVTPIKTVFTFIDEKLKDKIERSKSVLIYGCGVNADRIISILDIKKYVVCSGLPEEIGRIFHGKCVTDIDLVNFELFDNILITPIGYDSDIIPKFTSCKEGKVLGLDMLITDSKIVLKSRRLK